MSDVGMRPAPTFPRAAEPSCDVSAGRPAPLRVLRTLLALLVIASAGCKSDPPCHWDAISCECWEGIPEPHTQTCGVDDFGGAAACCRSSSYPAHDGYCHCGSIYCLADEFGFCECGFEPSAAGTQVEQCTGVCCLNTQQGSCYCSDVSAGGCQSGDRPTPTCSASSLAASGACGGLRQVTSCDP
jgi:hypothetical protein